MYSVIYLHRSCESDCKAGAWDIRRPTGESGSLPALSKRSQRGKQQDFLPDEVNLNFPVGGKSIGTSQLCSFLTTKV